MLLGLNLAVFGDRSLDEALDRAAALGLDTVEINAESNDRLTPLTDLLRPGRASALRQAVEARGLSISAVGNHADSQLIGGPHHADTDTIFRGSAPEKIAHGKRRLLDTARVASELGVGTVVGFTGCEDWSRWFPWPDAEGWHKMLAPFVDTWSPLLDQFGRLGVRFAHEPHPKQLVYDLETAALVTDALGRRPEWGFNLDAANLSLAGVEPAAFVQALPDRIYHVHAKDLEIVQHNVARSGLSAQGAWDRPDRGVRFRIPGWGNVAWKTLLSQLQLANYTGAISIEHEDPILGRDEGVEKAIDYLRPLIIRAPMPTRWW